MALIDNLVPGFVTTLFGSISWLQWIGIVFLLLGTVYWYLTRNYGKWEKKGVFSVPPKLFFGNQKDMLTQKKHMFDFYQDLYKEHKGHR